MQKTFHLVLFLFLVLHLSAQEKTNIKYWTEGKLEWSDFQEKENAGIVTSNLEQYFNYKISKIKKHDSIIFYREIKCYVDKDLTWVYTHAKHNQTLKYNQVLFDLGEYNRRLLQKKMYTLDSEFSAREQFENYISLSGNMLHKMQQETNYGTERNKVNEWAEKANALLNATSEHDIPNAGRKDFGFGYHISLGGASHSGSFSDYFSHRFAMSYGLDAGYKKSLISLNIYLDGITSEKQYKNELLWEKGDACSITLFDFTLGQSILDTRKIKITPIIGYGFAQLNQPPSKKEEKEKSEYLTSNNLVYGICFDYKLRKKFQLYSNIFEGKTKYTETSIRFRIHSTNLNFAPELQGNLINFSVGIAGFSNRLQIEE